MTLSFRSSRSRSVVRRAASTPISPLLMRASFAPPVYRGILAEMSPREDEDCQSSPCFFDVVNTSAVVFTLTRFEPLACSSVCSAESSPFCVMSRPVFCARAIWMASSRDTSAAYADGVPVSRAAATAAASHACFFFIYRSFSFCFMDQSNERDITGISYGNIFAKSREIPASYKVFTRNMIK